MLNRLLFVLVCFALATGLLAQNAVTLGAPKRANLGKILLVGDSITMGAGSPGGYRAILEQRLQSEGHYFEFVGGSTENSFSMEQPKHEGHGGWSTLDILNGKPDQPAKGKIVDWVTKYKPNFVLIMTGTNDDIWVTKQEWLAKYYALLKAVYTASPKVKVVLATIPKSNNGVTGKSWGEAVCYDVVRKEAVVFKSRGFKMAFVDTYTTFNPATDLADDYHPNAKGYQKIANAFYGGLMKLK